MPYSALGSWAKDSRAVWPSSVGIVVRCACGVLDGVRARKESVMDGPA